MCLRALFVLILHALISFSANFAFNILNAYAQIFNRAIKQLL